MVSPDDDGTWPEGLLTPSLQAFYNPEKSIDASLLADHNSGNVERGICALPFTRLSDGVLICFRSTSSATFTSATACPRAIRQPKRQHRRVGSRALRQICVLSEGLCLPEVPESVIARFSKIAADIAALKQAGYGILVRDASLGGQYPVMNVTLLNPQDQGCYCSFGAHAKPKRPALDRTAARART